MSTSDAGELERRVGGGERATPPCGTPRPAPTERAHRDETQGEKRTSHHNDETPTDQHYYRPGIRWEETHKARILRADGLKKDEAPRRSNSDFQNRRSDEPKFTSSLFLRLSSNLGFDRIAPKDGKSLDSFQQSVIEPQHSKDSCFQVDGGTSSPHIPVEKASVHLLLETRPFPANEGGEATSGRRTEQDLSVSRTFSNGGLGPQKRPKLHAHSCPGTDTGPSPAEAESQKHIKDQKKLESQADREGLSDPSVSMLSSTVVSVLAPHWSGRLRRAKKFEGAGSSDAQGNLQDPSAGMSAGGSQPQMRASFLGPRSHTVGWSTNSDPPGVDYDSKRKLLQTVSLDVNSRKVEDVGAGTVGPSAATGYHLDQSDQRRNPQTASRGRPAALSSKPTTSSLLLSLRRFNSNSRNSNEASTSSDINPPSPNASLSDPNGRVSATHLTHSFINNNEPKLLLSPSSPSYRTPETGPVLSPSSAGQRERHKSDSLFFPTSPLNKNAESTISKPQSSFTSSPQAFLHKGPLERQQNVRATDSSANPLSETPGSLARHAPMDHSPLQKAPVPRATLMSTSWWKQVTQEGSASLTRNDTASVKDKPDTPLTPPSHERRSCAASSPTESNRLGSQIPNNRHNNNTGESLFKGNMNRVLNPQGGAADLKQRSAVNLANQESDGVVKHQYGSNSNSKHLQKTYSMSDILSMPKFSRTLPQVTLSHLKEPNKHDVSNSYFAASVAELPPTLPSPRSPNTPTENSSEHNNNHWPPSPNNTPSSHMDTQQFTRTSRSPDFTSSTLGSQASPTSSGLSPASNTKSSFPFHPIPSEANAPPSSYAASSSQTPKFTDRAATTPLGFERNYASIPKPFQSKTVSNLLSSPLSKTNYHPTSITSNTFTSTSSAAPKATSPSLLSPHVTPATTASAFLTPPATPGVTNVSSPKVGRTFTSSLEREPKKKRVEGKRVRRVTFDPSVDLQYSESPSVEKQDTSPVPNNHTSMFGGKFRSLSSDSADLVSREREKNKQRNGDGVNFDQEAQSSAAPRQERTLSVESGTVQCRSTAPLSLPPDFSGYKLRYSSPPYSTLMSSRLAHGETKPITPRSPLFPQNSQSHYTFNRKPDTAAAKTLTSSKPVSPTKALQPLPSPFQKQIPSKSVALETDQVNNNHNKNTIQPPQSSSVVLVNRVNFGSQSLQGDRLSNTHSEYITEKLIYSIKPQVNAAPTALKSSTPKPLQQITNTLDTAQSREAAAKACRHSDQSSSGSSSTDSQSHVRVGSRIKESMLGKSRFLSVEVSGEQSPKKSRFALKKSVSTPNASLSRSDSEKSNKSGNKMDQVLHKLKKTFSTKRSDDDPSFSLRWRRSSQTPSVSGSSDISVESTKTLEEQVQDKGLNDLKTNTEDAERWAQNRYAIVQSSTVGKAAAGGHFSSWPEQATPQTKQQELNVSAEDKSENNSQVQLRVHSPTMHQYDIYKDTSTDYAATNQLLPCRDPSPCRSPNSSGAYQFRRSTPSPRSPFSPFGSLSPVSPFAPPDPTDDNVFYSPKLQRRKETPSPCEPVEGISLTGSRKSRASKGPPSIGPGPDAEQMASSYADLKYGIEPGRSFSVSSVLTSRPSGPGRISTGSRFMSVGDLTQSTLSCGGSSAGLDQWSVAPDRTSECSGQAPVDKHKWYFPSDPGKFRSRSLPRSLTRNLANWSSEASDPRALTATALKPAHLRSPNMNICHFPWDAEGPPTPPPTPPLSPVSRRMSKPPSLSSPTFPSTSGSPQADSQASRHLPSKSYRSSLGTFDESSDSGSDTTTDGDYYLESDDDEKETEL